MATQSRVPASAPVIGIVLIVLVALVVVLVAGGPDRWAAAAVLLIGVPLQIAMGGALDEARRVNPPPTAAEQRPKSAMVRTSLAVALVAQILPLIVTVLLIVFAVRAWANGDVVVGSVLVVVAATGVWRGWRTLRRLTGRE